MSNIKPNRNRLGETRTHADLDNNDNEYKSSQPLKDAVGGEDIKMHRILAESFNGKTWFANYLDISAAIKCLYRQYDGMFFDKELLERRFQEEAAVLQMKKSTHIVRLHYFMKKERWFVSEYCENGSLFDLLRSESKRYIVLNWRNRLKWMTDVALGMNILHNESSSVLHRDIKLSNIFLDEHYDAKVGDFGFCKLLRNEFDVPSIHCFNDKRLAWEPPEVLCTGKYSTKSDVYSFGVVMYEVLTLNYLGKAQFPSYPAEIILFDNTLEFKGLVAPDNRGDLPGTWHPCLEDYIEVMNQCLLQNPNGRPEFGQISRRLKDLYKGYEKHVAQ